jgi:uncharacterized membrane protein HdeD (DUF308 family)
MPASGSSPDRAAFAVLAEDLTARAVTGFRLAFGIGGAVALILGVVLLFWPDRTVVVLAAVLGIYFVIAGGLRVLSGIYAQTSPAGHRVLNIVLGLLLVLAGVVALKNLASTAAALLVLAVVVIGVGWIVDGVVSIVEAGSARSRGWAIAFGVISILAGIVVVAVPVWSIIYLITFAAITLIVLGVVGIVRGFTFGRGVVRDTEGHG